MSEINETPESGEGQEVLGQTWYDHVEESRKEAAKAAVPKEEATADEPWKSKSKDKEPTPKWARERFREYSSTVRDLKEQNAALMDSVKGILNQFKPKVDEATPEDFPNAAAYAKHIAEQSATQAVRGVLTEHQKAEAVRQERKELDGIHDRNVDSALQDIPDYHEAVANGDPDVTLPVSVIKHLKVSPAGPYVEYRIATDEDLAAQLKACTTPQQKWELVAAVHDEILGTLSKRAPGTAPAAAQQAPPPAQPQVQPGRQQAASPTRKAPPPAAPPKSRGMISSNDIQRVSADDWIKDRNAERRASRGAR